MKVLFVRPPKYNWPFINEQDNYLLPQGLLYLASYLAHEGHTVRAVDCMPMRIGWRSLAQVIRRERPDVVAAGDSETLYSAETGRVFALAKELDPEVVTVAGGYHFTHTPHESMAKYPIDVTVLGEGELTLAEVVASLPLTPQKASKIRGIAYRDGGGEIRTTAPRPLIEDLDGLPTPRFDLFPIRDYGTARYLFSPGGITAHHSRGCIDRCSFCACWRQMAQVRETRTGPVATPRWRTRSAARVVEEIDVLYHEYGKGCIIFTDDTWNVSGSFDEAFAETLLARGYRDLAWFAFMRVDFLLRDERAGIFEKLVRSGLRHVSIGLERAVTDDLARLRKTNQSERDMIECASLLKNKYPEVFRQATFLVGMPDESGKSLRRLGSFADRLDLHYPAFHPLTPVPGTDLWREARAQGRIEVTDYGRYDWMTPIMSTEHLTREDLEDELWTMNRRFMKLGRVLKGLATRHGYVRRMYVWWFFVAAKVILNQALLRLRLPGLYDNVTEDLYAGLVRPVWYDD